MKTLSLLLLCLGPVCFAGGDIVYAARYYAPGRDTTPYDKRANPRPGSAFRLVWTAPRSIRAAAGGPMRALTPRLSYVTAADWRPARPLMPLPLRQKKK